MGSKPPSILTRLFLLLAAMLVPDGAFPCGSFYADCSVHVSNPSDSSVFSCPAGHGESLSQNGIRIEVILFDRGPIVGYPAEDIWLGDWGATTPQGISLCQGGVHADHDTDESGHTTISGGPLSAGGWVQSGMAVFVGGVVVVGGDGPTLAIDMNSPDINGDLVVDLIDIGLFSADALTYQFRSDFADCCAPPLDLQDIGRFAAHIGHACP